MRKKLLLNWDRKNTFLRERGNPWTFVYGASVWHTFQQKRLETILRLLADVWVK